MLRVIFHSVGLILVLSGLCLGQWNDPHRSGSVLLVHVHHGRYYTILVRQQNGDWCLPGGNSLAGEAQSETAHRQLYQQTNGSFHINTYQLGGAFNNSVLSPHRHHMHMNETFVVRTNEFDHSRDLYRMAEKMKRAPNYPGFHATTGIALVPIDHLLWWAWYGHDEVDATDGYVFDYGQYGLSSVQKLHLERQLVHTLRDHYAEFQQKVVAAAASSHPLVANIIH